MAREQAAVAVVSWNTRDLLRANLLALRADHDAGRIEVWVVDNGSEDGSPELVAGEFPWVHLLVPVENLGFGRAVNLVASRTATPWIAPANADTQVSPGALSALLAAGDADPGAGLLGPRLRLDDGSVQRSVQPFPTLATTLLLHSRAHRLLPGIAGRLVRPEAWNPDAAARVPWVTGAFVLVRREAWDAVGGFDEEQWMYAEDIDLCWRLARAGWATRYVPEAEIRHVHGAAARQAFGSGTDRRWMLATYAWIARRQGTGTARVIAALNLAEARARARTFALVGGRDPVRWGPRRRALEAEAAVHAEALRAPTRLS